MSMVFDFIQTACVLIVLSYLLSRANFFSQIGGSEKLEKGKLLLTVGVFLFVSFYGVIIRAFLSSGMYVDTRIAGIALAGLLLGYVPSALVLLPNVVIALILREETLLPDLMAMLLAAGLSGFCHRRFPDFDAFLSGIIVGALEICHMLLIVFTVRPVSAAKEIVYTISFPMIVVNALAVIAFILMISDVNEHRRLWEQESFSKSQFLVAKQIQSAMLETDFNLDPRLDLSAFLEPAYDVGGDLYGFTLEGGRRFKFMIGDVSGKGVAAAIMMSRCETLFQELVLHPAPPNEILRLLNRRLCVKNRTQMFVTACVGCLDLCTGHLIYANAGHVTPYLIEADAAPQPLPRPKGKPLGILPLSKYENAEINMRPGQFFLSYTDGVTEAENHEKLLFGKERLEAALSELSAVSASAVQEALLSAVRTHSAGAPQSDDLAIFTFGMTGAPLRYTMQNEHAAFLEAAEKINRDLQERGTAQPLIDDAALILEEILSNILRYGYGDGRTGTITVSLWPETAPPIIQIEDDSDPFDPFEAETPNAEIAPERRPVGGLGIFLTKKRVTAHTYQSCDGVNTLTMQLRRSGVKV